MPPVAHRTNPSARCPACRAQIDGATGATDVNPPTEGDFSVCQYCATVLRFRANLTLRRATLADVEGLGPDMLRKIALVKAAVLLTLERKGAPQRP